MQEKESEDENLTDLPIAQQVEDETTNITIADIITANNLDDKYISIYKKSKKIKLLIFVQGILNLLFTILIHYWYILLTMLCYIGYYGINKYNYRYIMMYNICLFIDFSYHLINLINEFNDVSFTDNSLSIFILAIYIYLLIVIRNYTISIKYLTIDEILLLKSIKNTPSNSYSQNVLLI